MEASVRGDKKVYKMPLSKQVGRHVYGGKDPNSQLVLKRSLQGEGPVKLEKINHEIRIRQQENPGAVGGQSAKRGVRASLPPLQMQGDKLARRVAGARAQPNRQSSPDFVGSRSGAQTAEGKSSRRNKTAANSRVPRSPGKRNNEALLFQIQV